MSESLQVELTPDQRDVVLRGLRYIRSSIALEFREPSSENTENRNQQLQQIASLVDQLSGVPIAEWGSREGTKGHGLWA